MLVDLAIVKTFVRGLTTAEDAQVTQLIEWADGVLAAWLQWPVPSGARGPTLVESTYVDFLDGPALDDRRTLRLRMRPVVSVTEIVDDPDWVYAAPDAVDAAQYVVDPESGRVVLSRNASHVWSCDKRSIRATYLAGFPVATPPYHVQQAILLTIRQAWKLKHIEGLPNAALGGDDVTRLGAVARSSAWNFLIPDEVKELLGPHRLWEVGCV